MKYYFFYFHKIYQRYFLCFNTYIFILIEKYLNEKTLRGVIGCCKSHLVCYKKIIEDVNNDYSIIFEDDCCFIKGKEIKANEFIQSLTIPEKFVIIWLNEWNNSIDSKYKNVYYNIII